MMLQVDYWVTADWASNCMGLRHGLFAGMGKVRLEGVRNGHVIHCHFEGSMGIGSWR